MENEEYWTKDDTPSGSSLFDAIIIITVSPFIVGIILGLLYKFIPGKTIFWVAMALTVVILLPLLHRHVAMVLDNPRVRFRHPRHSIKTFAIIEACFTLVMVPDYLMFLGFATKTHELSMSMMLMPLFVSLTNVFFFCKSNKKDYDPNVKLFPWDHNSNSIINIFKIIGNLLD